MVLRPGGRDRSRPGGRVARSAARWRRAAGQRDRPRRPPLGCRHAFAHRRGRVAGMARPGVAGLWGAATRSALVGDLGDGSRLPHIRRCVMTRTIACLLLGTWAAATGTDGARADEWRYV